MKAKRLKKILREFYSVPMVNMILRGERTPALSKAIELNKKHKIPFSAWKDIKAYLKDEK